MQTCKECNGRCVYGVQFATSFFIFIYKILMQKKIRSLRGKCTGIKDYEQFFTKKLTVSNIVF